MASPRITKTMREGIVKNVITYTFKKEVAALSKREATLASIAYNATYTKAQVDAMKSLGNAFVEQSNAIVVNACGQRHSLFFGGALSAIPYYNQGEVGSVLRELGKGADEYRFVARRGDYTIKPSLGAEIVELAQDQTDLHERAKQAAVSLMAVLESVQSFKKLRAVWPQGEKFYDMYDVDSETKSGVPAVVITDLNKMLGITK